MDDARDGRGRAGTPLARRLAWLVGVPATLVFLLAGLWLFAGVLAPGYYSSFVLSAVWFVLALLALGMVRRKRFRC